MSNAAVALIEKRLESVNERVSRARTNLKLETTAFERTRADFRELEQEQIDLEVALEELAALIQEGAIRA